MRSYLPLLALICLLASSCQKDDAVEPCGSGVHEQGSSKSIVGKPIPIDDGIANQQMIEDPVPPPPSDDEGSGISDDGDDLSDSERTRKKRR